jgi:hypothetical protein
MHRSSASIGTIAAALAKAQLELINPEKSLTGTIPGMTPKGDRSFRYAPLSTGPDLVRKSLGRYEIATVQTTAVDQEAGLVRLTTILATHPASGSRPSGRCVRSPKQPPRSAWGRL